MKNLGLKAAVSLMLSATTVFAACENVNLQIKSQFSENVKSLKTLDYRIGLKPKVINQVVSTSSNKTITFTPTKNGTTASSAVTSQSNILSVLQSQNAMLALQNASLTSQLASRPLPTTFGQPYNNPFSDDTHLVYAHSVLAPFGGVGNYSVLGWRAEIQEMKACGVDGLALNFGALSAGYIIEINDILAAADIENASVRNADGTYQSNGEGVTRFRILINPDFSGGDMESTASLNQLATLFVGWSKHVSCDTYGGRPVLSCYVGDGGGVAAVSKIYPPLLSQIRSLGVNVFFWPGWGGDSGSTAAQECVAAGAEGDWAFPPGATVLGATSPLADIEATANGVESAMTTAGKPLLWMHPVFPLGYWKVQSPGVTKFYNEYVGMKSMAAQFASGISLNSARMELLTLDDAGEGTAIGSGASTAYLPNHWDYVYDTDKPDFYQTNAGLRLALSYWIQCYKTGQPPTIKSNTLIVSNRTQTAAASMAPTADPTGGVVAVNGALTDPVGLQDTVNVMTLTNKSGYVRLTGVGPTQVLPVSAGVNNLTFYNAQAGTPLIELLIQNQVIRQVAGHSIAPAPQLLCNLNPASFASVPGISFSVKAAIPTGFLLDGGGFVSRATQAAYRALGIKNVNLYDLSSGSAVLVAQNDLNSPQSLWNGNIVSYVPTVSTLATKSAKVSQYNGNSYIATLPNPTTNSSPALAYGVAPNTDNVDWFANNLCASSQMRIDCDVQMTSNDPDGTAGVAFVSSSAPNNHYQGVGVTAAIGLYGGIYSLQIRACDNLSIDSLSTGQPALATLSLNKMAIGETAHLSATLQNGILTATVTPGNQQL